MKYKEIEIPIYGGSVMLYSGKVDDCNIHFYKTNNTDHKDIISNGYYGVCMTLNTGVEMIWINSHNDYNTVSHEITHLVKNILLVRCGMIHTSDSTEAWAYLTGWITEQWFSKDGWKSYTRTELKKMRKKKTNP